jgi:sortase (surface protein transpeptidase)
MEVATQLMKVEKGEQIKVYQEIKNISSTKEKLDTLRVITDTTKKPVKPREKTVAPTPTPTIEPVIIPLVTNRPWIYNENKEKVTIPEDLWGEIIELVYDYQATH